MWPFALAVSGWCDGHPDTLLLREMDCRNSFEIIEPKATANTMSCSSVFIPCWLQELAPVTTTIIVLVGAILIPLLTYRASRAQQRRQAALDLARTLYTSAEITARLEKLYRKRRFEESIQERLVPPFEDPYQGSKEALIFDLVMVLNYFETICVEVKLRNASEETLREAVGVTVVGARDKLLTRLDGLLEADQVAAYATLVEIAERFRVELQESGGLTEIPHPKDQSSD